ncbi:MAG: PAC2 family protein, partial [Actinobacteria bacterium]|nr:PAC2 family protein [Actinomycetota bacterium]NIS33109.1 PAC2 family protein [Actinomycetota bacterium]NIT96642.1 PAC2 family protein [Actinomycetota bacterium]NIU20332.1 PAC2 family protein [Actinomycetota bacterium]NIU68032.1 PAC2 family protein [Actinomycetota bacterium]
MTSYRITGPLPASADPVLVVGLDGWVNAGQAATAAAAFLAGEGPAVVEWDADDLFDYRASRPTLSFEQGVFVAVEYPQLVLRRNRVGDRDLLVLTGTEPNWNWRRLASEVADLAGTLGAAEYVSLGGIP